MSLAEELAKKHIPEHNAIAEASQDGRDESHFHCEQCAEVIKARCVAAINEAIDRCAAVAQAESDTHPDQSEACDCAEKIRALKGETER